MLKILVILTLLSSCTIDFTSRRATRDRSNKEKISTILGSARKVEHVEFENWRNHYLDDLKFDVFIDEKGSKVGIWNKEVYNPNSTTISKLTVAEQLDKIMKRFEKSAEITWTNEKEINKIFIELNDDKIDRLLNQPFEETKKDSENKRKHRQSGEKYLGSNRKIKLVTKSFSDLQSWENDLKISDAVIAFTKSCDIFAKIGKTPMETKNLRLGTADLWYDTCAKLKEFTSSGEITNEQTRQYFEENFTPVKVYQSRFGKYTDVGLFTGYYELDLPGSIEKTSVYKYPIYALPPECKTGSCVTREQIFDGKLDNRGLELYYAKSNFDIFMLQIQGSGVVSFEDGKFGRVGFGGTNKRGGRNIFAYMKKKCIPKCNANLGEIIEWFESNPEGGMDVLAKSDSYVFFRKLDNNGDGAVGASGIPLVPSRSLAVDDNFIPYGVPVWVETYIAVKDGNGYFTRIKRLFVAQDTGEAIVGSVRADVFYGHGPKARYLAEKQKFDGIYYMLIPNNVIPYVKVK